MTTENEKKSETSDYSSTKAPENQPHVQSKTPTASDTLNPGGPQRAKAEVGMSELDRDTVPNEATDTGQTRYGNSSPPERHGSDRGRK